MNRAAGDRTALGIVCMLAFTAIAPLMDAAAKATPHDVPVTQILMFRFGIQVAVLLPLSALLGLTVLPSRQDWPRHLMRALTLVLATWCFFVAVRFMPIANAASIFFVAPLMVTLAGGVFLGEDVGPRRIIACLVGFGGALLVIRPSFQDLGLVALLPLGTAAFFTTYMLLTRTMSRDAHPVALQGQTALAASVILIPLMALGEGSGWAPLDPIWPTGLAIYTLAAVGLIATVSHLFITYALKFAPAATVAPLQYLEIIGATIVGYYMFGDFPDGLTWLGIFIIVGSGLFLIARERKVARRVRKPVKAPR